MQTSVFMSHLLLQLLQSAVVLALIAPCPLDILRLPPHLCRADKRRAQVLWLTLATSWSLTSRRGLTTHTSTLVAWAPALLRCL
jgi:hypothetical protein